MLGTVLTGALRTQAVEDAETSLTQYTSAVIGPQLVQDGEVVVDADATAVDPGATSTSAPSIVSVKVWRPDGVLAWTSLDPERIGRAYPLGGGPARRRSRRERPRATSRIFPTKRMRPRPIWASTTLLEVYAPITLRRSEVVGAYEIYADSAPLEASIAAVAV